MLSTVEHFMTGSNRGFAFVDFHCIADAQYWMEQTQVLQSLSPSTGFTFFGSMVQVLSSFPVSCRRWDWDGLDD